MRILESKEIKNAGWLIAGKIAQMLLSFFVGLMTARYLGPSNYGLINYATAYVTFFTALCTLGINSVIVKDFFDAPEEQGIAIGSSIVLRTISCFLSAIMIVGIVTIIDAGERETIIVTALCSVALLFQSFDTINYWFQSRYESKVSAISGFIGYGIVAIYKIFLLITHKSIEWFAISTALDYAIVAVINLFVYSKHDGPKLAFSIEKSKKLLSKSYHYILSGLLVSLYSHTDRLMLKQMLSETEVGYYSVASYLCTIWAFVLTAIIDSMYPTIMQLHKKDHNLFERKNKQLYSIVFYVSVFVSLLFTVFGPFVIKLLYGEAYLPAIAPLRIVTWYCAFSYLGVARNAWIVSENKQKYLKYMYSSAAVINIVLNYLLIPKFASSGAAAASLITQVFTSMILPLIFKDMRKNVKLMVDAILLRGVFKSK